LQGVIISYRLTAQGNGTLQPDCFMEVAMYSEVSGIFNRAERLWRNVFTAETLDRNAGDRNQRDSDEASARKHRNWTEEDFLWCWQHRGFW
jgi:hypothetical protein